MDRGFNTVGRGSQYHGSGFDIPWAWGQNNIGRGVKISWVGVKIPCIRGRYDMGMVSRHHG